MFAQVVGTKRQQEHEWAKADFLDKKTSTGRANRKNLDHDMQRQEIIARHSKKMFARRRRQ